MLDRLILLARLLTTPGAVAFAALYTVDSFARAMMMTIVPLEALRLAGNARDLSLLFFAVSWGAFLARFVIPALIRAFRRRRVYTFGLVLLMVAPFLLVTETIAGLAIAMLMRSFGGACVNINFNLYLMDYVRREDLVRAEPLRFGLSAGSWIAGPTVGVVVLERVDPLAAFALVAVFEALALAYFWYLRMIESPAVAPMTTPPPNPLRFVRRFFSQPRLVLAWVLGFGREFWWALFLVYGPVYVVAAGAGREDAAVLGSAGMVSMLIAPLSGWLARRYGVRQVLFIGYLVLGAATLAVLAVFDRWLVGAAFLLAGTVAVSACDSVGNVTFFRAVRKRERPEMTMVYSTWGEAANLSSMAVSSVLLSVFDLWIVFLATGLAMFGFAVLARRVPRRL
jgi:MFS family permease